MREGNSLVDNDFFEERIRIIEELLERAETLLDEVLGKDEEDAKEVTVSIKEEHPELFELFAQLLSTLKEKEENMLRVPWARWKTVQSQRVLNWEKVTLSDLLALYHIYLSQEEKTREIPIDDSFEKLLFERREAVRRIVQR
ncbi:MAG: hypothetical protein N2Z84_04900, partial [Atribacterota bacterium]|nr:hypothetical protein [Atribacterota bacterium]